MRMWVASLLLSYKSFLGLLLLLPYAHSSLCWGATYHHVLCVSQRRPLPTELPKREPPPTTSSHNGGLSEGDKMGMERLEGESEASYVARQCSLQESARVSFCYKKPKIFAYCFFVVEYI